jgi:hypothetical protein
VISSGITEFSLAFRVGFRAFGVLHEIGASPSERFVLLGGVLEAIYLVICFLTMALARGVGAFFCGSLTLLPTVTDD